MEVPFALALERGKALKLQGSEFRLHQSRDDRARLLRGLAARRPHRPHLREREAAGAGALVRRRGGGERGGREGDGRVDRRAADVVRQGARRTVRRRCAPRFGRCPAAPARDAARRTWRRDVRPRHASARASAHPGNYAAQLALGQALAAAGDRAAFEPLEKAAALVPVASGEDSPHAMMAAPRRAARRHRRARSRNTRRCWRRTTRPWRRRGGSPRSPRSRGRHRRDAHARVLAHRRHRSVRSCRAQRPRPARGDGATMRRQRSVNSRRRWRSARPTSAGGALRSRRSAPARQPASGGEDRSAGGARNRAELRSCAGAAPPRHPGGRPRRRPAMNRLLPAATAAGLLLWAAPQ